VGVRIGHGFDVHRLVDGRDLILGGVRIPFEKGLLGHSDGDCLLHAICDSILGAAGLGDLGRHFPDTDPAYKDISSLILLKRVKGLLEEKGFIVGNVDATIVCQAPRISSYVDQMEENIARTLSITQAKVNVKATTTEGLGFEGKGEGIAAFSVVLLVKGP